MNIENIKRALSKVTKEPLIRSSGGTGEELVVTGKSRHVIATLEGHNKVNDAEFFAHAKEYIEFLLNIIENRRN